MKKDQKHTPAMDVLLCFNGFLQVSPTLVAAFGTKNYHLLAMVQQHNISELHAPQSSCGMRSNTTIYRSNLQSERKYNFPTTAEKNTGTINQHQQH